MQEATLDMRRAQCGFESDGVAGARTMLTSETVGAQWSVAVDAASARTGAYGMHVTRTATASAFSAGGYRTIQSNAGSPRWGSAPNAANQATKFLGKGAGLPKRLWLRIYHQPVVINASAGNTFYMLEGETAGGVSWASLALRGSPAAYVLMTSDTQRVIMNQPSVGTWYRLELMIEIDHVYSTTFDYHVSAWVYTATGTVPLGFGSFSATGASLGDLELVHMGYKVAGIQTAAIQEGYFDDFAMNDDLVAAGQSGIHVQSPWGGACRALALPNFDGTVAWTKGGTSPVGTNFDGVNDWPPNDGTDLNFTPADTSTPQDRLLVQNPTIPGSQVVKSAAVVSRAQDLAGGFAYYKMGLYENATNLEVDNNQTGGWFYNCAAVGEVGGGGPWTNTKANNAEVMYRKTTSDATAQQEVTAIVVEWEDDDGMGDPPALPAKQRPRGGVF